MFIDDVCSALKIAGVSYAVVGGVAVALHGAVRGTIDIDIAIRWTLKELTKTEEALRHLGLVSRLPIDAAAVFNFRDEYIQQRHLIAWNFYDPLKPVNQVDIIINYDLSKKQTKTIHTPSGSIRILNLKDLLAMKKSSGRPQDLEDVHALEELWHEKQSKSLPKNISKNAPH